MQKNKDLHYYCIDFIRYKGSNKLWHRFYC